jgi:hypothetical protein
MRLCCFTYPPFFRWKLEFGKAWHHLGGELMGQTQVSYCKYNADEELNLDHPIDAHFAVTGLQVALLIYWYFSYIFMFRVGVHLVWWFSLFVWIGMEEGSCMDMVSFMFR